MKVEIRKLGRRASPKKLKAPTKRTGWTIDAGSPSFAQEVLYVFGKSVTKARKKAATRSRNADKSNAGK